MQVPRDRTEVGPGAEIPAEAREHERLGRFVALVVKNRTSQDVRRWTIDGIAHVWPMQCEQSD
jgi:hypothetical protein